MSAVPLPRATMTPVEETVATDVSLDVYVTPVDIYIGALGTSVTVATRAWVAPARSVTDEGWTVRLWRNAEIGATVIVAVATMDGEATEATRIVAAPGEMPRTTPLASTVAMNVWSEVYVTAVFALACDGTTDGVSVTVAPTAIVA
jgi:hypothetical protein